MTRKKDKEYARAWFSMGRTNPNEFENVWEAVEHVRKMKEKEKRQKKRRAL